MLKRSPQLDAAVQVCVDRLGVSVDKSGPDARQVLRVSVACGKAPPIGLGFEVLAEFGGQALSLGPLPISPRDAILESNTATELAGGAPETVTIVLKSSKEAAMWTVDLFEIWGGELRFENVAVVEKGNQPPELREKRYSPTIVRPDSRSERHPSPTSSAPASSAAGP